MEDELVKKYSLPSKFSDFLLDPHKVKIPKNTYFAFPCILWVVAETSVCWLGFRMTKSLELENPPKIVKPNCYPVLPRPPLNNVPECHSTYLLNPERSRAGKPTILKAGLLRDDMAWTSQTVVCFENLRCNCLLVFPIVCITCLQVKTWFPGVREMGELQSSWLLQVLGPRPGCM